MIHCILSFTGLVTDLADRVLAHLDEVLESASLSDEVAESYRRIVVDNVKGL